MDGQIRYLANGVVDLIVVTQFTILKRPSTFRLGEEKRLERTSELIYSGEALSAGTVGILLEFRACSPIPHNPTLTNSE